MKANHRAAIGFAGWAGWVGATVPDLHHAAWAHALLMLSALVLVPLALELAADEGGEGWAARLVAAARAGQLPAAILLGWSCWLPQGGWAALAAAPWVAFCGAVAATGWLRVRGGGWRRPLGKLCGDAALMFLGVGGAWLLADRAGFRPLDFDPAIVTLTAVHFHFAGLLLPLFAGRALGAFPDSRAASRAAVGVVLGVPAVAVGITTTQLGWGPAFEGAAGWGLALSAMSVAILHVRLAVEPGGAWLGRGLFGIAGVSLFFGMLLAGFYATRAFAVPLPWLDLPWMRALHGTMNALGFGLGGTVAWSLKRPRRL
jgi:hypothetical protein